MLHNFLSETAKKQPEKIVVIQGQRRVTYRELDYGISSLATFLINNGILTGDRVGIFAENSPEYVIAYFGAQKAGAISVDINSYYSSQEVKKILISCLPKVLIVETKFYKTALKTINESTSVTIMILIDSQRKGAFQSLSALQKPPSHVSIFLLDDILKDGSVNTSYPRIDKRNVASIIYTSGTTGEPKGVMLTHNNFLSNAVSIIEYLHLSKDDRAMVILPLCYSYGKSILNTHVMAGGALVFENSFMYPNVVLNRMVEEEVTGLSGVPFTFAILLNRSAIRSYRFPKLRYVTQAGGPMSPKYAKELSSILPNADIYIMYGQTEATARLTYLDPQNLHRKPGSIGKPIPGVEIELIKSDGTLAEKGEEGEVVVRGKNVMAGYWNNPEDTKKVIRGDKLFTGDIGRIDEDGYFYIVGRRSDMIKSGSHRISPKEIEEVILEMKEIHEVTVVGIVDEILGESIKAFIILKDGFDMDAKTVQRFCKKNLAPFKIPKEVVFTRELPKTSSGKIQRHLLKDQKTLQSKNFSLE
jgi:long-chain acyl-CoA synthetase